MDLSGASLNGANLNQSYLMQSNFSGADLSRISCQRADFSRALLSGADLNQADLTRAILLETNLSRANLRSANLSCAIALGANFSETVLTAACLQDWSINSQTQLVDVQCDYVYLQRDRQQRYPCHQNFVLGEFIQYFQPEQRSVDLIFRNGVNWEAFAYALRQLQKKAGTATLSIQAIENKGYSTLLIRTQLPTGTNKHAMQQFVEQQYREALNAVEDKYQTKFQASDRELALYRQQNANLWEMAKWMAGRPIVSNPIQ